MKERGSFNEGQNPNEDYAYTEEALREVNRALSGEVTVFPIARLFDAMQRMNIIMRGREDPVLQQTREEILSESRNQKLSRGALDMLNGIRALESAKTEEGVTDFESGYDDIYVNQYQDGRIIPTWIEAEGRVAVSFRPVNFTGSAGTQLEQTAIDAQRL